MVASLLFTNLLRRSSLTNGRSIAQISKSDLSMNSYLDTLPGPAEADVDEKVTLLSAENLLRVNGGEANLDSYDEKRSGQEEVPNPSDIDLQSEERIAMHTFVSQKNLTLMGVGMGRMQFATWVQYYLSYISDDGEALERQHFGARFRGLEPSIEGILCRTATQELINETDWESNIESMRNYWKLGRLICEQTSLLTSRGRRLSAGRSAKDDEGGLDGAALEAKREDDECRMRAEQFSDTLHSYAERLVGIVEDELSDVHFLGSAYNMGLEIRLPNRTDDRGIRHKFSFIEKTGRKNKPLYQWSSKKGLLGWIEDNYGFQQTQLLKADALLMTSEKNQLEQLQLFLDWFRSVFPYYHDKCESCGASCKEDPNPKDSTGADIESEEDDDFSFLGYVYPTPSERMGNASRTEIFRCRRCSSFTRFPRYNKALWVASHKRGRCGEYSMLLYRMLRALGYANSRWVVDWADHVWADVWLGDQVGERIEGGRWVHLDPCEASVDNPLLYQGWGKNQTCILGFYDPYVKDEAVGATGFPLIEDITSQYTSDELSTIEERRGISKEFIQDSIHNCTMRMDELLSNVTRNR